MITSISARSIVMFFAAGSGMLHAALEEEMMWRYEEVTTFDPLLVEERCDSVEDAKDEDADLHALVQSHTEVTRMRQSRSANQVRQNSEIAMEAFVDMGADDAKAPLLKRDIVKTSISRSHRRSTPGGPLELASWIVDYSLNVIDRLY
mmetsp:Transcript_39623/g.62934  ORF Transcript_39623/g.62934 Transcript_39623/m.62934 type:complete len:148 (+) Transcript_39623:60-503(+)